MVVKNTLRAGKGKQVFSKNKFQIYFDRNKNKRSNCRFYPTRAQLFAELPTNIIILNQPDICTFLKCQKVSAALQKRSGTNYC